MKWVFIIVIVLLLIVGGYYFVTGDFSGSKLPYDPNFNDPNADGTVGNFFGLHAPSLVNNQGHVYNALGQQIS